MNLPNSYYDRAHALSNALKMDDVQHAALIKLLHDTHELGFTEGFDAAETEYEYDPAQDDDKGAV